MGELYMLVIRKKTVIVVLVTLCMIIFSALWLRINKTESIECFTPATNKRVVVDFGHGLPDRRHKL